MASTVTERPLRVLVCGTNFGRLYLHAVQVMAGVELAGILSRGGPASAELAKRYRVPHWTSVTEVSPEIDLACVVVGSTVSGGDGFDLVIALLERGIHVLQEHPVHPDEITAAVRTARRNQVQYRLSTHYRHVETVRAFLTAARQLRARSELRFVDAAGPVHVLQPLVDILGRAVGGLRPWAFTDPVPRAAELAAIERVPAALTSVDGVLGGVPLTLRVHNQLHPGDRDNHALLWPRITLGSDAGVLSLADLHGPVLWSPRLHTRRDSRHRLDFDADSDRRRLPTAAPVSGTDPPTAGQLFDETWPDAIAHALGELRDGIDTGADVLRAAQADITMTRAWLDLTRRIGPPVSIQSVAPPVLPVAALTGEAVPVTEDVPVISGDSTVAAADAYAPAAEFFELAAAEHARQTAATVCAVLADVDLSAAPVVDVGAGTGLVGLALASARPELTLLAAEPSAAMRAVLTARVLDDPDLQQRVTVTADAAPELNLPRQISAAIVCGVVGHLSVSERRRLWARLRERLVPGGVIVLETMGLPVGARVEQARLARTTLGDLDYEWWFSTQPLPDGRLSLQTSWRVAGPDGADREVRDAYTWDPVGLDAIADEAGLELITLPSREDASMPMGALLVPG